MSDEVREAVLTEVHAGHFGTKRMMGKINQRFYWIGIVMDVEDWVRKRPILITNCSNIAVDTLLGSTLSQLALDRLFQGPHLCALPEVREGEDRGTEELKSIKPVSPWYMIGEFYSFHI